MITAPIHPDTSAINPQPRIRSCGVAASEQRLHPLLTATVQALEQANLRWCLLREPTNPEAPTGDVDLLIHPTDRLAVFQILKGLGFVRLPAWGYGSAGFFLGYHPGTDHWIWLHVVFELAFGPYYRVKTGAEEGCLARREQNEALAELAPDDAFWVLLLHCLLDKRKIASRHRAGLRELVTQARADSPLATFTGEICPSGWSPASMITAAKRQEWTRLERLAPSLVGTALRQAPIATHQRLALAGLQRTSQMLNILRPMMWRRYFGQRRWRVVP
ncbi:hypothetical protein [Nitrolancea hollandica]|uniref:Nucleotidyltransferase family protein n=1 Tax=Nitrolancea hollandica Lb TaxID=1129897 RepID=I4EDW8_9BACT|nr:hypothetical protein [Nitrolancea hollandica]CCF82880.1 hypothetical protein NITHO_1640008 [Nitrolancea hollandica Lb]